MDHYRSYDSPKFDPCFVDEPEFGWGKQNYFLEEDYLCKDFFHEELSVEKYGQKELERTGTGNQSLIQPQNDQIYYPLQQEQEQEKEKENNKKIHVSPKVADKTWGLIDSQLDTVFKKSKVAAGERFQTKNITKYFKTETEKYLKVLQSIHIFDQQQVKEVTRFILSTDTLESFSSLFKNSKIKLKCRQFYQSRRFITNILTCKKEMKTKITLIKYLEKIRMTTYHSIIKGWKQD